MSAGSFSFQLDQNQRCNSTERFRVQKNVLIPAKTAKFPSVTEIASGPPYYRYTFDLLNIFNAKIIDMINDGEFFVVVEVRRKYAHYEK